MAAAASLLLGDLIDQLQAQALGAAAPIEAGFRETLRREAILGEWRLVEGALPDVLALHARYADLAVVGQRDPGEPAPDAGLAIEQVLFAAGRPVLVVPHAGSFESLRTARAGRLECQPGGGAGGGRRAADPGRGREQSRCWRSTRTPRRTRWVAEPGADIALHSGAAWRDGEGRARDRADDTPDAEVLLNKASELAADLIVVGAYGHSRLGRWCCGGVTRTLLQRMTVPVLMSH